MLNKSYNKIFSLKKGDFPMLNQNNNCPGGTLYTIRPGDPLSSLA
jgi:hypothetical protein